jgi:hypothetical protein
MFITNVRWQCSLTMFVHNVRPKCNAIDVQPLPLQANKELTDVKKFRVALRHAQHAAIFECFREFNRKGGAVVPLQTGGYIYFARACILAIYADYPAARKCTLTGSACPVCYTPVKKMALAEQEPRHALKRTHENMTGRKRILHLMATTGKKGANERATKLAKRLGVNLQHVNAWTDADAPLWEKVFGACLARDNIYQCVPQPNLHGMDEGLTSKTNSGVLEALIKEARLSSNLTPTAVGPLFMYTVHVLILFPL